jgi:hypothetical protein
MCISFSGGSCKYRVETSLLNYDGLEGILKDSLHFWNIYAKICMTFLSRLFYLLKENDYHSTIIYDKCLLTYSINDNGLSFFFFFFKFKGKTVSHIFF